MATLLCHSLVHQYIMQLIILIFSGGIFIFYAALLLYYRAGWRNIPEIPPPASNIQPSAFITVIIPARNEAQNINACLNSLISQSYPSHLFEVLVIDDHSTDDTAKLVGSYSATNIRLISLQQYITDGPLNSYKKKAIDTGIQQSKGELIVTTDADCITPVTWLQMIASFYEEKKPAFMVMPVAIMCRNNFEIFQALDFMTMQGITGAAVHKRMHSMCNGANLAYTKKAFYEVEGFKDIDNIASGDDMLLMHKIRKRYPRDIYFLRSKELIVQTQPMHSVSAFINQRIRWASKADRYDDKKITSVLLLVYLFNAMLLALAIASLFNNIQYSLFDVQFSIFTFCLLLIIFKTVIELFFLYPVARFFNKQRLLWWFPVAQPFHIVYIVIAGWLGKFGSYQWKERKVK